MKFFKALYIEPRFFQAGIAIVILFGFSYFVPFLFNFSQALILVLLTFLFVDLLIVFIGNSRLDAKRIVPDKFSNGDTNTIKVEIENNYPIKISCSIIDELPEQFQKRDFKLSCKINPKETTTINYELRPTERGEYHFGNINVSPKYE